MAQDKYTNVLTQEIVMSGADAISFQEVNIGLSLFDKAGILISRIEYQPYRSSIALMTAATDELAMAVTSSNGLSDLAIDQASVIHYMNLLRVDFGTAAAAALIQLPFVFNFADLPGGGMLITPKPWYVAMDSTGLATAAGGFIRFFFTVIKLSAENYFELLETRHYFG